jgi:hypothetical protein
MAHGAKLEADKGNEQIAGHPANQRENVRRLQGQCLGQQRTSTHDSHHGVDVHRVLRDDDLAGDVRHLPCTVQLIAHALSGSVRHKAAQRHCTDRKAVRVELQLQTVEFVHKQRLQHSTPIGHDRLLALDAKTAVVPRIHSG